ncbi:MAG: DUF3299 domain-containing protein [Planctomycetota bacterium]|nr:DUF3299 domain-containing protein [Planctomycetota bacterium]MDP7133656.1 DUF3299 domain-containing protein [Planctomycetota bacterium]MDP7250556.1 DUF3299 domain-containing protein [Planctomycetota bacterium]
MRPLIHCLFLTATVNAIFLAPAAGEDRSLEELKKETITPTSRDNGFLKVAFAFLASYKPRVPNPFADEPEDLPPLNKQIPEKVKGISGEDVVIEGFMYPLKLVKGKTDIFLLLRNQSACCYGKFPMLNEWVYVTKEGGVEYVPDVPTKVYGKLDVGDKKVGKSKVTSIYRMVCTGIKTDGSKPKPLKK